MALSANPQVPGSSSDTYSPDRLIAGALHVVTQGGVLIAGQNLTRGALLGKITASGKVTLSLAASGDGSQVPYAILAEDTNATAADTACGLYMTGEFNSAAMTFGTGHSATTTVTLDGLRDTGIFLKTSLPAT